jgi:predicted enzyme related to lactoylglutathione lyase
MPEREGFPPGVPSWIDTDQADPHRAASFYAELFGWELENRMPAGSPPYLVATLDGKDVAGIRQAAAGPGSAAAWNTYIGVQDADASAATVRKAGGRVLSEPVEVGDLGRMARCADPAGAAFSVWQPGTVKGAGSVNAPGTWNFSELNARDSEGAKRFYGAVFGWEGDVVDMGALAGTMLRLPGYADFLEQYDPGIRQRHADFGAPPGFSECIGWIVPLEGDEAPHWSVRFAVADADQVAARALELGGSVMVEPFDSPPVRSAVLRDPAGAPFSVSAFSPG